MVYTFRTKEPKIHTHQTDSYIVFMCGSRNLPSVEMVVNPISDYLSELKNTHRENLTVVIGDAEGFDTIVAELCAMNNIRVVVYIPSNKTQPRKDILEIIENRDFDSISWGHAEKTRSYLYRDGYMSNIAHDMFAVCLDDSPGTTRNITKWIERNKREEVKRPLRYVKFSTYLKEGEVYSGF